MNMKAYSAGWFLALFFLFGFVAAGFYTFDVLSKRKRDTEYATCMRSASLSQGHWPRGQSMTDCNRIYSASAGGLYGPAPGATISLAMTRRPNFGYRY